MSFSIHFFLNTNNPLNIIRPHDLSFVTYKTIEKKILIENLWSTINVYASNISTLNFHFSFLSTLFNSHPFFPGMQYW